MATFDEWKTMDEWNQRVHYVAALFGSAPAPIAERMTRLLGSIVVAEATVPIPNGTLADAARADILALPGRQLAAILAESIEEKLRAFQRLAYQKFLDLDAAWQQSEYERQKKEQVASEPEAVAVEETAA